MSTPTPGAAFVQALDRYTEAKSNMDFAQYHPDRKEDLTADLEAARQELVVAFDSAITQHMENKQ